MKKLLLISIALLFIGCSSKQIVKPTTNIQECTEWTKTLTKTTLNFLESSQKLDPTSKESLEGNREVANDVYNFMDKTLMYCAYTQSEISRIENDKGKLKGYIRI